MFSFLGCGSTTAGILVTLLDDFYWRTTALYLGILLGSHFHSYYLGGLSVIFCGLILIILHTDNIRPQKKETNGNSSLYHIISSNVIWGIALSYLFTLEVSFKFFEFYDLIKARTVGETWLPLFIEEHKLSSAKFLTISETSG